MKNIHRIKYLIFALVVLSGPFSIAGRKTNSQTPVPAQDEEQEKWKQRVDEARKHFPTADFDEPALPDPEKRAARQQKQKRHNGLGLVQRNPSLDSGGGGFLPEGLFDFPALPVAKSDAVVVGEVKDAQAHLSEDKTNVYSEFTIRVDTVFKSASSIPVGSQITVERIGGYVKYPDGRKLLYQVAGSYMPQVGLKYVFFLGWVPETEDYSILTGYRLGTEGVSPLDSSGQFEVLRGQTEAAFMTALNDVLTKNSTPLE